VTDEAWVRIRDRLHDLRLAAGKPSFSQIGKDSGLHFSTVGNAMRGYSSNPPGRDTLAKIWTHLGGDLTELRALYPLTAPTHVKSEVFLACPACRSVLEFKLRQTDSDRHTREATEGT
jgi:hypothetical protein